VAIQNLLNCDGLLPARVKGAYWKLQSTGGSVGFGGVTPYSERWVPQISLQISPQMQPLAPFAVPVQKTINF